MALNAKKKKKLKNTIFSQCAASSQNSGHSPKYKTHKCTAHLLLSKVTNTDKNTALNFEISVQKLLYFFLPRVVKVQQPFMWAQASCNASLQKLHCDFDKIYFNSHVEICLPS